MKKYVQGEFITAFQYGVDSPPFWFYHTCISDEETTYIEKLWNQLFSEIF